MTDRDTDEVQPVSTNTLTNIRETILKLRQEDGLLADMRELPIGFVQGVMSMSFGESDDQQFVIATIDPGDARLVIKDVYIFRHDDVKAFRVTRSFNELDKRTDDSYRATLTKWQDQIADMQEWEREIEIQRVRDAYNKAHDAFHLCRDIERLYEKGFIDKDERNNRIAAIDFEYEIALEGDETSVTEYDQILIETIVRLTARMGVSTRLDHEADNEIQAILSGLVSPDGSDPIQFGEPQAWNLIRILDRAVDEYSQPSV